MTECFTLNRCQEEKTEIKFFGNTSIENLYYTLLSLRCFDKIANNQVSSFYNILEKKGICLSQSFWSPLIDGKRATDINQMFEKLDEWLFNQKKERKMKIRKHLINGGLFLGEVWENMSLDLNIHLWTLFYQFFFHRGIQKKKGRGIRNRKRRRVKTSNLTVP